MSINLQGTRGIIFDVALERFTVAGFDDSNIRDIAKRVGIKGASIYSHYQSKQAILDAIYDYYEKYFLDNIKSEQAIKRIIEQKTKKEIIENLIFTFVSNDQQKYRRMILITKLIYMRIFIDERAKYIFSELMNKRVGEYVKNALDYGISIGRFKPFDTSAFALLLINSKHTMGLKAFTSSDYQIKQLDEESKMDELLAWLLIQNV